jgi:hypothetical protein
LNPTKFFYFFSAAIQAALNRSGQGLAEKDLDKFPPLYRRQLNEMQYSKGFQVRQAGILDWQGFGENLQQILIQRYFLILIHK